MKKKLILSSLLLSTLVLSPSVLANETVSVVEPPIEVADPIVPLTESPVASGNAEGPVNFPVEEVPSVPEPLAPIEVPTTPIEVPEKPKEEPSTPVEEAYKQAEPKEEPLVPIVDKPTEKPIEETPKKAEEPKITEEAKPAPANTSGATVTPAEPIYIEEAIVTETGHTVVGVQGEAVLVQDEAGKVEAKPLEQVGATKDAEGTITVKDNRGGMKVLPNTGTRASILTALGFSILSIMAIVKRKEIIQVLKKFKQVADKEDEV